jgi:hypothetical protein
VREHEEREGRSGGAYPVVTGVWGCWRVKFCDGRELKMVVAGGGALRQERGKEEEKPWCGESRGISRPFIGPGGVWRGAVPVKKRSPLMEAMMHAFRAHQGSE